MFNWQNHKPLGVQEAVLQQATDAVGQLTREQLQELEQKEKTPLQHAVDFFITLLPMLCGVAAMLEYLLIADKYQNRYPERYFFLLQFIYG